MLTVMVCALMLGICLLLAGAISLALKASENHERNSVTRTPLTAIASWRPGASRVAATGWTAYGPAGPVVAPLSGQECAWFTISLIRTPSRRMDDSDTGEDVLWTRTSLASPVLADSSGGILLDPRLLATAPNLHDPVATKSSLRVYEKQTVSTAPSFVPRDLVVDIRGHESIRLWETRLAAGVAVFAFGAVGRGDGYPQLQPRSGLTVLTTDTRPEVIERRRTQAIDSRKLAIFFGRFGLVVTLVSGAFVYLLIT